MQPLKITIITVCLNAEKTIKKCIQSVVAQSYPFIEYIVIDGKSSDHTVKFIRQMQRADILISESDAGLYDAMNKGVERATGDYIFFLNADDYIVDANVISNAVEEIKQDVSDIYYGNIEVRTYQHGVSIYKPWNENSLISALSIYCLPHQAMFAKTALFKKIGGFSTKYKILSDYEWYLRAYDAGAKFKYFDVLISSFSFDGLSSNPSNRLHEFYLIQNASKMYGGGDYDVIRIESSLYRLNELEAELLSASILQGASSEDWEISSLPISLAALILQKKIQELETFKYEAAGLG